MSLIEYANTERQKEIAALIDSGVSASEAGRQVYNDASTGRKMARILRSRSAKKDRAEHISQTPDGFGIKKTSTMYNKDGEVSAQWVIRTQDQERQEELMRQAIEALAEDLPRLQPVGESDHQYQSSLMAVYPLGDPHIGLMSWGEETGQDWDMKIAEPKFCGVFDRLVKTAPHCDEAVILNLGDFFHSDNMEGVTSRSGHHLDMDGRYAKMT